MSPHNPFAKDTSASDTAEQEISLSQKLNLETAKLFWKELEIFFAKGNLLQVAKGEDLIKVAEMIANNDQDEIESLILNKKIEFTTPDWVKHHCQSNTELWTVVVAPYVVCQLA